MFRKTILILVTFLLFYACSCGGKKHHTETNAHTVSEKQVTTEDFNRIGEKLQCFLSQNGGPLKGWPFKEWGYQFVGNKMVSRMPKGTIISGDVLRDFLNLDQVNHYNSNLCENRDEWVERRLNSGEEYRYCGYLDVSDSLHCYIYTVVNEGEAGYRDAFALIVKDDSAVGSVQLACEGYGLWDSIETNRIARNIFVMRTFAVDVIDENGDSPGGYYSIQINDDGTITRRDALESDFNKPTWN